MSDYSMFDFTVNENDVLTVLKNAIAAGLVPMLYINGLYYNVQIDAAPVQDAGDELPF